MRWRGPLVGRVAVAALTLAAAAVSGCGLRSTAQEVPAAPNDSAAAAFAQAMVTHNATAVALAETALRRNPPGAVTGLARRMVRGRTDENRRLQVVLERLYAGRVPAEARPPLLLLDGQRPLTELDIPINGLGLPPDLAGFLTRIGPLDTARPFDRSFIDLVVPLDQGAIRLARAALDRTGDPQVEAVAQQVIRTRACEIVVLNRWRQGRHGLPSPAGGVPSTEPLARRAAARCTPDGQPRGADASS